ncbi:2-C-methyl-D-erythritol 4-phosphate cytidylyltransferase IspD [Gottschalkia acidurici 9a]|uniref:2-C-methyl-D-erythritol 4-phosphate cytidylyltransferase n=1 Tax=Gottschalkia acidurici (strain ATCC 7906 / DSM 604 / BCRC 14475 / CIP 104303 / KCTC 5404 / NCIMB 10678 / 9a) TaxID=1128398 RepID=K0AZT8_GOTA9|nr:2-C-methyl-D-erythritol 4-phosphate cytidylyltransferase [Gottschalkia acidurici]AFS79313.1 2-C-methyl-D-erythritol 4-phosphate cytidylyltransferase IspD [Gottschalkia acidurici 9a]
MSYKGNHISVIVVAAGMGKRMRSSINKQYLLLKDRPILSYTIDKFENNQYVDEIIIVTREEEIEYCMANVIERYKFKKVKGVIPGGNERQDSVYNGLKKVNPKCNIVLIHDGVRPFIRDSDINKMIEKTMTHKACVVGVKVKDTIKVVDSENNIVDTPDRNTLWAVHTPQCFSYELILKAHERCKEEGLLVTDDSMLVEKLGGKVKMIEGNYDNIKITTPEDLYIAESILKQEIENV